MHALDPAEITREFMRIVARRSPRCLEIAALTLERIPPARWQLEWYLPWWLGDGFGLSPHCARQLVLSNVLGLAHIRLKDDLADNEHERATQARVSELAPLLLDSAFAIYKPYFPARSLFWTRAQDYMALWRDATASVNQLELDPAELEDPRSTSARQLVSLGAPLKICALAVCLLTRRERQFPALEHVLDHVLLATVLYDHMMDCAADLRAGRWNLFVAAVSDLPQSAEFDRENRASVARAWMTPGVTQAYVDHIAFQIERARAYSAPLAVPGLESFLAQFIPRVRSTQVALTEHYTQKLERAAQQLFAGLG